MLLGTFHFKDAGLDVYKVQHDINILSTQRQRELEDIVERLAAFQPTKVCIEHRPDRQLETDEEYRDYCRGEFELAPNEIYQLGFRLARKLGLEGVCCVDAWGRYYDPPIDPEQYAAGRSTRELDEYLEREFHFDPWKSVADYAAQHGQEGLLEQWSGYFTAQFARDDREKLDRSLREMLVEGNSPEVIKSLGPYLVDWFKIGQGSEYAGVDLITSWFNRNLRIFSNIQRITRPGDRIFVVYGGGHIPILRICAEASPEYELVEVKEYLG